MEDNWEPVNMLEKKHIGEYVLIEETDDRTAFGYLLDIEGHEEEHVLNPCIKYGDQYDEDENPWFIKHDDVIQAYIWRENEIK